MRHMIKNYNKKKRLQSVLYLPAFQLSSDLKHYSFFFPYIKDAQYIYQPNSRTEVIVNLSCRTLCIVIKGL